MKIGLTGTNAAGKTSVVRYFTERGFEHFSLSDAIRDELSARNLEHSRVNLRIIGNELRATYGPAILAQKTVHKISLENVVIDSIRNIFEVAELRKLTDFYLIAIDAPIEIRFNRALSRGRLENAATILEFKELEDREKSKMNTEQNIDQCIKAADFAIFNNGNLKDLSRKLDDIVELISKR